jgi:hypothetical protein
MFPHNKNLQRVLKKILLQDALHNGKHHGEEVYDKKIRFFQSEIRNPKSQIEGGGGRVQCSRDKSERIDFRSSLNRSEAIT